MQNRKQYFTFTFTAKVSRKTAEKLLDSIISLFQLVGLELSVDFTGGFNIDTEINKL